MANKRRYQEGSLADERLEAVVAAAGRGDDWALATLYRELHPPLVGYLRAREPRLGEDLASETWLRVAAGVSSFEGDASAFRSWVFTIARCRLIDHRRQLSRRGYVADLDALVAHSSADETEAEALDALSTDAALRTINALPYDQADVVLLRLVAGLDTPQVAAIMGKPAGTVRVLQHRALRRLAKLLGEEV